MDYKVFEKEEFNCLSQKQKSVLLEVLNMSKEQNAAETASLIMKVIPMLESEGELSNEQKKAIVMCIVQNMSDEERKRAEAIFHFMGM